MSDPNQTRMKETQPGPSPGFIVDLVKDDSHSRSESNERMSAWQLALLGTPAGSLGTAAVDRHRNWTPLSPAEECTRLIQDSPSAPSWNPTPSTSPQREADSGPQQGGITVLVVHVHITVISCSCSQISTGS